MTMACAGALRRCSPTARRGFNLKDSQIERTDWLDRLVMVLGLALYWAVSTGVWDAMENKPHAEKKTRRGNARTSRAA